VAVADSVIVGVGANTRDGRTWDLHTIGLHGSERVFQSEPAFGWSPQGVLFAIRGTAWAVPFDQQARGPSLGALATRLVVLRDHAAEVTERPSMRKSA
jgi:hypothetical protein